MNRLKFHIVLLLTILITGCETEPVPTIETPDLQLTIMCDDSTPTKADPTKDGEQTFNENIIKSVDFLFYPGASPAADADAVFHIRKELSLDSMTPGNWAETFNLVVKKDDIGRIFTEANNNQATVYALVNFEPSFISDLSATSRNDLAARRVITDFAQNEYGYVQPSFIMDGSAVVQFHEDAAINVVATIPVYRFASKLTIGVNVANSVTLKHRNSEHDPDEVWEPVLHTMRAYLMDGIKSVVLSSNDNVPLPDMATKDPNPDYFFYKDELCRRPFVRANGTSYFEAENVSGKDYITTWPMYSYPSTWSTIMPNYSEIDYVNGKLENGLPPEPPYIKLEMDWRRLAQNGYDYDRRKYYYKVYLPFDELKRNKWYGFFVDVSILGSETDEGKAVLDPTCYLLDWQNKSLAINKYAVISKARYLSVDKTDWEINNMNTLTIPFLSSHNVKVVTGSVTATRPFLGELGKNGYVLGEYNDKLHAWIRGNEADGYYLDYTHQPEGKEKWEPSKWLTNTSTAIILNHELVNNNTKDDFDYSVYTIDFDIIHTDLADDPSSVTYAQYLRHITIVQRPGIYIEKLRNSDTEIQRRNPASTATKDLYGYTDGSEPWAEKPWGYVYVNGGRFVRSETTSPQGSEDRYFTLKTPNNKREYQWQTVWYTGGSKEIYDIHVTVLPSTSGFVIGDPRESRVNNLDSPVKYPGLYEFTLDGNSSEDKWHDVLILESIRNGSTEYVENPSGVWKRTGFNKADALYGDEPYRSLKWYYPTDKTTRTENMVAPSYRISSKFSGIEFGNLDMKYAEYRCAAFQEDGFPAGRWRLPTKAEINFIGQLSAKKFFEFLFNDGSVYWSANGAIKVNGSSVSDDPSTTALLRCVYDSWYWDKIDGLEGDPRHNPRNKFVWGDRER